MSLARVDSTKLGVRWADVECRTLWYTGFLASVTALLGTALALQGERLSHIWAVAGLAVAAAFAERGRVRLNSRHEESISLLPTLCAAVIGGPFAGLLVGAASFGGDLRRPYGRWLVYTCSRALSGAAAGLAAEHFNGIVRQPSGAALVSTAAGAVAIALSDALIVGATAFVRGIYRTPFGALRARAPFVFASLLFAPATVGLLVIAYRNVSPWTLLLVAAPALTAHRLYVLYQGKAELAEGLTVANLKLKEAPVMLASALVAALDARDAYTAGHSEAVARMAMGIAGELRLSREDQELIYQSGLVHDIGKIGVPEGLLEKPGPLTPAERIAIQSHSLIGSQILEMGAMSRALIDAVRYHHERMDGRGYPEGLKGDEIPLAARIIAVADAFDAMVSHRPYRDALTRDVAIERLQDGTGTQFDEEVVAAFVTWIQTNDSRPTSDESSDRSTARRTRLVAVA